MDWQDLFAAIALVMIIEGMLPFLSPRSLRRAYMMIAQMDDKSIRSVGLVSMGLGLVLLMVVR